LRLLEPTAGTIRFDGMDITHLKEAKLRPLRKRMQIIVQDPHAALNPAMTIGQSIADPLIIHEGASETEAKASALDIMNEVGLAPAEQLFAKYPGDLSGGQKQRAVIARAMILKPELIVADEPVAMLDMSIRSRVLEVILDLKRRYGHTYLFITHDVAAAESALGPVEHWEASGLVARRPGRAEDPGNLADKIRVILAEVKSPMTEAIDVVDVDRNDVVIRFRPPAKLEPVNIEGRVVECLLY